MSGIYVHFPFCKKKCLYCNFYSVATLSLKDQYIQSLVKELELTREYLPDNRLNTLYFGGGTPSLFSFNELESIINSIRSHYTFDSGIEFSFEANPEQLSLEYLKQLKLVGVNRLSIGIQSFNDRILHFLKRGHSAEEAKKSIENAVLAGFENISIDLIYGIAYREKDEWESDLHTAFSYPIRHLSAYSLSVEENTLLFRKIQNKQIPEIDDNLSEKDFNKLLEISEKNGFEQYEISNFAKDGKISQHNSSYWNGTPYLGLGPSAHSYNMESRQWNIADVRQYISGLERNVPVSEKEFLSTATKFNEYVLLSLRTSSGIRLRYVEDTFGKEIAAYLTDQLHKTDRNFYLITGDCITLSREGKLWADRIAMELFMEP